MDAAHRRPLVGEVLVLNGLLGEEQLAAALDEQRRTGERLGAILVASGVLAGPTLAMALADQHGAAVNTEHGWATGWAQPRTAPRAQAAAEDAGDARTLPPDPPAARETTLDELARAVDAKQRELDAVNDELERVQQELRELRALGDGDAAAADKPSTLDEPDRLDFLVVGVVDGQYLVHLGRGTPPAVGTELRLPGSPDLTHVVARDRWRHCLYLEPARNARSSLGRLPA